MLTTDSFSYFLSHVLLLLGKKLESVFLQGRKKKISIEGAGERESIQATDKMKVIIGARS